MNLKEYYKQQLLDQLDEAKKVRKKVNPKHDSPRNSDQFPKPTPSSVDVNHPAAALAIAIARDKMFERYGKGKVTHESHSGGHFIEHEREGGDAHAHTFHPVTGKISREPHVTSSYYGE